MKPNCKGCEEEWGMVEEYWEKGYHLADSWNTRLGEKGKHFIILMVDDDGRIIVS